MKLNTKRTIFVGCAFLAISAFWQLYDSVIPLILKYFFNIGDTLSGGIMALDNIFALFMLPIFGAWSDRVNTKYGKRTPFIYFGTILSAIFMILIPIAANTRNLIFFIIALLMTLVSMGIYRSPAVSLMPDVTPKPLRSRANAIINLMGAVGIIVVLGLIMVLSGEGNTPNYIPLFSCVAGLMIIALVILTLSVKENKLVEERIKIEEEYNVCDEEEERTINQKLPKDVKRSLIFLLLSVAFWYMSYNAISSAFSKYAVEMWGMAGGSYASAVMVASIGAVVAFIPAGRLASKFGRKKVILFGVVVMALSVFAFTFVTVPTIIVQILFAIVGLAWATINVNSYPMVVEMCSGADIGKFTGYYYTFSMAAQVVTPILSGFFLEKVGYITLFPYATVFAVLAFITMAQVHHGDSKPIPSKKGIEVFEDMDVD